MEYFQWKWNGMEYYSAIKNNEILPFVTTWMDLEGITLTEISQTEKDKYHMISLICRIKKQNYFLVLKIYISIHYVWQLKPKEW